MNTFNRIQNILLILIFCTYCNTSSLNKNIAAANNVESLQKNITSIFAEKYKEKSKTLSQEVIDYFRCHKFNKWQYIKYDINKGYDNCFCKEVMFKHLNIKNINQKHYAYLNLKKALNGDEHLSDNNIYDSKQAASEHNMQQNEIEQLNDIKNILDGVSSNLFQLNNICTRLILLQTKLKNRHENNYQQNLELEKEYIQLSKEYAKCYKHDMLNLNKMNNNKTVVNKLSSTQSQF